MSTEGAAEAERASRAGFGRAAAGLAATVLVVFAPTLFFGFVDWDDDQYVFGNPLLVSSRPLLEHLLTPRIGYPIPLTVMSYRLDAWLGGLAHPGIFHATNVLLHATNVALLMALSRRLGAGTLAASIAGVLFGLHPVVAEPVAWVTGRKDLLCTTFALAAMTAAAAPPNRGREWRTNLLAIAALAAKPTAVALAPLLLFVPASKSATSSPSLRERLVALAPFLVVAVASVPLAYALHRDVGGLRVEGDLADKAHRALYALGFHLRLVVGLEEPTVKYAVEPLPAHLVPSVDLLPALLVPIAFLADRWLDEGRRERARFGAAIALFAYLPVSNLIPLYRFLADSYLYLPLAGIALAASAIVEPLLERTPRPSFYGGAAVVLLAALLAPASMASAARFRDTETLFAHGHARYPGSFMLCRNWASSLGDPARVLDATDRCIARFGPDGLEKNRAIALFQSGRFDEAVVWARRSLARHPEDRSMPNALLDAASHR